MHYHMQNEEYSKVVEACKRYGDQEVCLWEQALGYFARKEEDCKAYISEVLHHIDQNNLMPPLLGKLPVSRCFVLWFYIIYVLYMVLWFSQLWVLHQICNVDCLLKWVILCHVKPTCSQLSKLCKLQMWNIIYCS